MQLQLVGKHIEITPALKQIIEKKCHVLTKHYEKILSLHITLHVENVTQIAEGMLHAGGTDLFAKAESDDMYKSVDLMIEKLVTQINKHKEKVIESHR